MSLNGRNGHRPKKKLGRPPTFNNRITTIICGRLAQGKSLRKICEKRYLPTISTVMDWVIKHPDFAERYFAAKKLRADWAAQKTIDVAEEATPETAAVARLKVDVYKWHASKLDTNAYGDKPSEVHVNSTVNNNLFVMSQEQMNKLQQRHQEALSR